MSSHMQFHFMGVRLSSIRAMVQQPGLWIEACLQLSVQDAACTSRTMHTLGQD